MHPSEKYALDVLNGNIVACRWVRLACSRHLDDLKYGKDRGLYFDEDKADHALSFFPLLKLWKGKEYKGKPFVLSPHFEFIISNLFGWCNADGLRRFRIAYLEMGRKNAKSSLAGGVGDYMFTATGESGAEIYAAAVDKNQSKIVWTHSRNLLKGSELNDEITIKYNNNNLSIEDTWSKYEPLSKETKGMDGLDTYCGILDELHAHPDPKIHDLVCDSTGTRADPLILIITTAGFNQAGVCFQRRDFLTKILKGIIPKKESDSFFGMIYTLDRKSDWSELKTLAEYEKDPTGEIEDDWEDEDLWIKSNPGLLGISKSGKRYGVDKKGHPVLGYMRKIEDIRKDVSYARETPAALNNFLTKKMNIWTNQASRWISLSLWDRNFKYEINEDQFKGKLCFGGIDLSATLDLTPWVMLFPDPRDKLLIHILMRIWCPESRLYDQKNKYKELYQGWKHQGFLETTPGNMVDYDFIRHRVVQDAQKFKVDSIAIDRLFQGYEFAARLDDELGGSERKPKIFACGMGYVTMAPLCLEFERRLREEKLNHGGNPILRWMADNCAVKKNPAGTVDKVDKGESQGKVDGIVATLLALDRLMRVMSWKKSKYESSGLTSL